MLCSQVDVWEPLPPAVCVRLCVRVYIVKIKKISGATE